MTRGRRPLAALLVLGLLAAIVLPSPGPVRTRVIGQSTSVVYALPVRSETARVNEDLEVDVLNVLNEKRMRMGLVPLMPHATIQRAAREHGLEMFTHGYLSHRSRDGRMPQERLRDLGVNVHFVGENLAYAADVWQAYDALLASPPHRSNILYPGYRLIGIGVIDGGEDGVVVVQDFSDEGRYPLTQWWVTP